jgi:hypothetical protein
MQVVDRRLVQDLQLGDAAVGAAERVSVPTRDGKGVRRQQVPPEWCRPEGKRAAAFRPVRQDERGIAGDGFPAALVLS